MSKQHPSNAGMSMIVRLGLLGALLLAALLMTFYLLGQRRVQIEPATISDTTSAASSTAISSSSASASASPDSASQPAPSLEQLAALCLPALSQRYPRGRLLKVQINQRAQMCNALLETDEHSQRFFGVQWRYSYKDFLQLGEVRLPASYLAAEHLPTQLLDWNALLSLEPAALAARLITADRLPQVEPWAIQLVWMPAPFERPVWMIGYDFEGEFNWSMEVADPQEVEQVNNSMPALAEDLEDPNAAPDIIADRTADKVAAMALEGGAPIAGTVYESAQWCANLLSEYNGAVRILRVALRPGECTLVMESFQYDGQWVALRMTELQHYTELGRITLPDAYLPLANFTLDPAWLRAQALADRLQRSGISATPQFIGIAFDSVSRDAVWLVEPLQLERSGSPSIRFDRAGQSSKALFPRLEFDRSGDADAELFEQSAESNN